MKTTIDLPDDLLMEAKAVAARRRTTLRAMVERALRREVSPHQEPQEGSPFEINELGMLVLKRSGRNVALEDIEALEDRLDREDMERAIDPNRP